MRPVQAGKLRHRIIIQTFTLEQDDFGQQVRSPITLVERWASVEPLRGQELMNARQVQADVTHRVRVRKADGVTPKMQVVFDNRTFEILSVLNIEERGRLVEIYCKESV